MSQRNLFGYTMGLLIFMILIPIGMWRISGDVHPGCLQIVCSVVLAMIGISLSIWTIVYMRLVGKGNPMDAFDHEIGQRTSVLMTDGPYRLCRNPMLLGVFVYYLGLQICLSSWRAAAVFVLFAAVMMVQVNSEEKRLERDFGNDYLTYKAKTRKLIPFIW